MMSGEGMWGHSGGHYYNPNKAARDFLADVVAHHTSGIKDSSSALTAAFNHAVESEKKDCKKDEAIYRPYTTSHDVVSVVPVSSRAQNEKAAATVLSTMRQEMSYIRARLRTLFKSLQMRDITHGVRRGHDLSGRMLVDSMASIRSNRMPDRAYQRRGENIDMTMSAVMVLDQSGSMTSILTHAVGGMMLLADSLDNLQCPVAAIGFRDGRDIQYNYESGFHRHQAVKIDIFKGFDERFAAAKIRFMEARAEGGTPMADGVQEALMMIGKRAENHRVIFVLTDGVPNAGHMPVLRRQIRKAREAEIHVIGVGIGRGAEYVKSTFDDYLFVPKISELPKQLIEKLTAIADNRKVKVGRNKLLKD